MENCDYSIDKVINRIKEDELDPMVFNIYVGLCEKEWNNKAKAFFKSATPEDPQYYATTKLEYCDEERQKFKDFCNTHTWQEILDKYFETAHKGITMTGARTIYYNEGNGSPTQFGFGYHFYFRPVIDKILYYLFRKHCIDFSEDSYLNTSMSQCVCERKLQFGHVATAKITIKFNIDIDKKKKSRPFYLSVMTYSNHDPGYHEEFDIIAKELREMIKEYKETSKIFKMYSK